MLVFFMVLDIFLFYRSRLGHIINIEKKQRSKQKQINVDSARNLMTDLHKYIEEKLIQVKVLLTNRKTGDYG